MVQQQLPLIQDLQTDEWWQDVTTPMLENVRKRIRALVKKGEEEGATVFQAKAELPKRGYFFPPTLMTNVQPASTCARVAPGEP